jgi:hypothetical protein
MRAARVAMGALACALVAGAFALVGYAAVHDDSRSNRGAAPGRPSVFAPIDITAVRALDARHLEVTAQIPGPGSDCATRLRGSVTEVDGSRAYVNVVFDSMLGGVYRACTEPRSARVTVRVPTRPTRVLFDGDTGWQWGLRSDGTTYRQCTGPFGCDSPPRNHCDPAWLTLAGHTGELPPERSYKNRGCDGTWLVMDVDAAVTGCQPLDGRPAPTGCADAGHHVRWFFRFTKGWTVVAAGNSAGCADVHATVPDFPTRLCAKLPAR